MKKVKARLVPKRSYMVIRRSPSRTRNYFFRCELCKKFYNEHHSYGAWGICPICLNTFETPF